MADAVPDPYTVRQGEAHAPPQSFRNRIKYLGPSLIVTGAVIGSGELVLTTSLGAKVGWALLWFLLLSCWCKSLVQAEYARYTIVSGDTYMRALNRIPGKIGPISWPVWLGLIAFIPGTMGLGGILGGAGEALSFLTSLLDNAIDPAASLMLSPTWSTAIIALVSSIILSVGSYKWLEGFMLFFVASFTLATLVCTIAMQFTEYQIAALDIVGGLSPDFTLFAAAAALALGAYGYTGTTSGDIASYTYWCIEKGYPSYVGSDRSAASWEAHARGWMRVLHTDVWLALIILTCATIPFYVLGAGVLNKMGLDPQGAGNTISVLSNIFTQTLGPWAVWIFSIGAFFILFSTILSSIGAGGRFIPDYFVELGFLERSNLAARRSIVRWYVGILPIAAFLIYKFSPGFVFLIIVGGLTSALLLPLQCGWGIWLQRKNMDPRIRPRKLTQYGLWVIFAFELIMAFLVLRYVVFPRFFA
ncbi:MAG: hypothetical protein CME16_01290 [Gemmatimonadetes bacterium]|nr:hypothetical protein [Gemmatimonadota bacterium]